jgi:hypothetical protein
MHTRTVNWWKWNIRPTDDTAVGTQELAVYIYLPQSRDDGTEFNDETNIIPFELEILAAAVQPGSFFDTTLGRIAAVTGAIVGIAGVIGTVYKGYKFFQKKRQPAKRRRKH